MVLDNLFILKKKSDFEIDVFCVYTEEEDGELARGYGFEADFEPNKPLGRKFNWGLSEAMKYDFDYLIQCGSDDIITQDYLDYIRPELEAGTPYFGVKTLYNINPERKLMKKWTYDVNHPCGLGRCFSKETLRRVLKETELWPSDINRGLDTYSDVNMIKSGFRCKLLPHNKPMMYCLKSEEG